MLFPPYDVMWSLSSGLVKPDLIIGCSLEDTACGYKAHHTFSHRKRYRRTEEKVALQRKTMNLRSIGSKFMLWFCDEQLPS